MYDNDTNRTYVFYMEYLFNIMESFYFLFYVSVFSHACIDFSASGNSIQILIFYILFQ